VRGTTELREVKTGVFAAGELSATCEVFTHPVPTRRSAIPILKNIRRCIDPLVPLVSASALRWETAIERT